MIRWNPILGLGVLVLLLTGCNSAVEKHMRKPSRALMADLKKQNLSLAAPILIRIFKESSEFEVWKMSESGTYVLVRTYPICEWSGFLGRKRAEGDRQSPEGFYMISPPQMNPFSKYYLSFDLGFPNELDEFYGYHGSFLMVHGGCKSVGCYAMTDSIMADIYALARESFFGGQELIQVHAFPFRMSYENLLRYEEHPDFAFWWNLKEGYDFFEKYRRAPRISICEGRYLFDAVSVDAERWDSPFYTCPEGLGLDFLIETQWEEEDFVDPELEASLISE